MLRLIIYFISITIITTLLPITGLAQNKRYFDAAAVERLASAMATARTPEERDKLLDSNKQMLTRDAERGIIDEGLSLIEEGEDTKALNYFHLAETIAERLGDKTGVAKALNGMGFTYYLLYRDYKQAMELYSASIALSEESNDLSGVASGVLGLGDICSMLGDYDQALGHYQRSLSISEKLDDKESIIMALGCISEVYISQGNLEQALEYAYRSLLLSEKLGNRLLSSKANYLLGFIYYAQKDLSKALSCFQKNLALCEELKLRRGIAYGLYSVGLINSARGDYNLALDFLQRSLAHSEQLKLKLLVIYTSIEIGNTYRLRGENETALSFANRAANLARQDGDLDEYWSASLVAGQAYYALKRYDESRQSLEEAVHIIEQLRSGVAGGEQERQLFLDDKIAPYHELVDLNITLKSNREAFAYAERAKARVILDVLQSGRMNVVRTMSSSEREMEKRIKDDLVSLNTQAFNEQHRDKPDKAKLADLEIKLREVRSEMESFYTNLYIAHPELKARRAEFSPIRLEEIDASLLDDSTAILEFVVAENSTNLFVLTRTAQGQVELKVYKYEMKREELSGHVKRFRDMVAGKDLAFRKPGHDLYDILLKPAQEQLKGKTTLIIIPEDVLWELPFQVLLTPKNRYLLENYTIFYTPSLTALREMKKLQNDRAGGYSETKTLLAFGNPDLGKEGGRHISPQSGTGRLGQLLSSEVLVKQLARLYGPSSSKYYTGANASEKRLKMEAAGYRILQFATHGILNDENPMYSYLVLSPGTGDDEDGLLEAREIAEMDLQTELVVLAACQTARGKVRAGEGIVGLTWSLFIAGCPATVVSQWKVDDAATKDLMLEFHSVLKTRYDNRGASIAKAAALRQGALKLMHTTDYSHPFYWAGFVMIGNGN